MNEGKEEEKATSPNEAAALAIFICGLINFNVVLFFPWEIGMFSSLVSLGIVSILFRPAFPKEKKEQHISPSD